jgi:hypothetical protein
MRARDRGGIMSDETSATDVETPVNSADQVDQPVAVDELDDIEDLDELEFLLEEIESKIAPLALIPQV